MRAVSSDERALRLLIELMAIPGRSGDEARIIETLQRYFQTAGLSASAMYIDAAGRRSAFRGNCGNLIIRLPGTCRAPRRLLTAHVDTVPICENCRPVRDGAVIRSANPDTGVGGDDRSGVAVLANALMTLLEQELPHPPLTFLFTVQEEVGTLGARHVALGRLGNPKLCFNWDGGAPNSMAIAAVGGETMDIYINGIASHAGVHPDEGVSAIAIASIAINDLTQNGWHGLVAKAEGTGTSNIGEFHGGEATNVVPAHVHLTAEARSHIPRFRRRIVAAYRSAFTDAAKRVRNFEKQSGSVRFESELKYESFRLSPDAESVRVARTAIEMVGLRPEELVCNGGLDANWLTHRGFPTVTLGCGYRGAHTVGEVVHVSEFLDACRIALILATGDV